jgi:transitional endoplasmic reticulum ATPase
MAAAGVSVGEVVRIATERGRSVLARLGSSREDDAGSGMIRLDRFLRQALKARLNEEVEIERVAVGPVKVVELVPAIDVSMAHDLLPHLKAMLVAHQTPVSVGAVLYIPFPGSVAGTTYTVHRVDAGYGVVTDATEVQLHYHDAHLAEGHFDVTFEDVGGLDREIRLVRELVQLPLQFPHVYRQLGISPPRGIIFYGSPGTGKTHLARAVANEVEARFYYINGPDVVGTYSGETEGNLRRIFNEASHHSPSIIFIDELDALAPRRGETGAHSDTRAVTQLLALMDGLTRVDAVIVIGTTNRIESVDPAFRRPGRFDREILFGPPDAKGRMEILEIHTREMPLAPPALHYLREVARSTGGFVGADLMELCREAGLNALRRSTLALQDPRAAFRIRSEQMMVETADFEAALSRVRPSALRETFMSIPDVSWEEIGGLEPVKARLRELVRTPLQDPRLFAAMEIVPDSGILLYGPPGGGKTLLAKAIAHECGANFIPVEGPELFTKWLGESEERVRHLFQIARQVAPAVIFFDQLDAIAPVRGHHSGAMTTERVVSQLLTELDGMEPLSHVIVIGATNRPDLVDPSLLRPGRFATHLYVPLPDAEERAQIIRIHLRGVPLDPESSVEAVVTELCPKTEGFSGAKIRHLCTEAKLAALRSAHFARVVPVRREHFLEALQTIETEGPEGERRQYERA